METSRASRRWIAFSLRDAQQRGVTSRWNQNKVALTAQNISNIQQDSRLPVAIALFNRETMECDRFHVSTLPMTCIVQSFACDFRVQKTCIVFLFDLRLVGSQQKTVGV